MYCIVVFPHLKMPCRTLQYALEVINHAVTNRLPFEVVYNV